MGSRKSTIRLFSIIFIFLCGLSSIKAQDKTGWNLKAIECERLLFEGDGELDVEGILLEKARCYKQAGMYSEASATLARISLYGLDEDKVDEILYEKELCSYLAGDFNEAASYVASSLRWDDDAVILHSLVMAAVGEYKDSEQIAALMNSADDSKLRALFANAPEEKKEGMNTLLSFLPPLGHMYTGNNGEGWLSMGLNAGSAAWLVGQTLTGNYITGILGGAIALNYTFMGNLERTSFLLKQYNTNSRIDFTEKLRTVLQQMRYE